MSTRPSSLWRRRWPGFVLLGGLILFILAVLTGRFLEGRIILLGPLDAVIVVEVLGIAAVWCFAAYRGDGMIYDRVNLPLPYVDRSASFAHDHRVETDVNGRSFLICPQDHGGQARVLLPAD